jgi:hypothetical protein
MNLNLERDVCGADCTLGKLSIDGTFEAFTCEDVVRTGLPKIPSKTAIPAGRYRVIITHSPRFKRSLPQLVNVTGFDGVRIHPGNDAGDTSGCILVGRMRTPTGVAASRLAFDVLFQEIANAIDSGEEVWITIR